MDIDLYMVSFIAILIFISAFFSGSETALMSSSKPKLHSLEKENYKAKLVNKILRNPTELLSTILLGNNLVNIASSALATVLFTKMFGASGVVYATLVMTFVVLIFAEILPKTIASLFPEKIAMKIVSIMNTISFVLRPFTKMINMLINVLLKLFGVKNNSEESGFNEDDIRGAINLGLKTGILERGEHRMLDSIVELDTITAEEVMQHRSKIESIDISLDIDDIFSIVKKSSHSRIPVYEEDPDNIIGILYVKDFLPAYAISIKTKKSFKIKDILKEAIFIPESALISNLLLEFRKTRSHMRFVVNEYGNLQGLVTLEDILEEIVGDIEDEHDNTQNQFIKNKDGTITISGFYSIRDCNRNFDWDLPDEDHITLGGFIASIAEKLPKKGDVVEYENLKFEVLSTKKQAILKLKAYK